MERQTSKYIDQILENRRILEMSDSCTTMSVMLMTISYTTFAQTRTTSVYAYIHTCVCVYIYMYVKSIKHPIKSSQVSKRHILGALGRAVARELAL